MIRKREEKDDETGYTPIEPLNRRKVKIKIRSVRKGEISLYAESEGDTKIDYIPIEPLSRRKVKVKIRSIRRGRISLYEKSE